MRDALSVFLLRSGLGGVYLWFGIEKLRNPSAWYAWVPLIIQNRLPISMDTYLDILGIAEIVLGGLILMGLFMRAACFFIALLIGIMIYFMGFNQVMVRDLGLLAVALALIVSGAKQISVDHLFSGKKRRY